MVDDESEWSPAMMGKSAKDRAAMSGVNGSMVESVN